MEKSQRLRLRNRQILCRYGVEPNIADRIFDLQVAGWTAERLAAMLKKLCKLVAAGMTADEFDAALNVAE